MQVFVNKEKLGVLSWNGSNLLLPPSVLTIGAKQYVTSALTVGLPSLSANSRYQVYAVIISTQVQLVVSNRENSQGPLGYSSWKLVGSFYSNGKTPVSFGSLVNIKGKPSTEWISDGVVRIGATTTAPTKGTIDFDELLYKIDGKHVFISSNFRQTTLGTNGAGDYLFPVPKAIDTSKHIPYSVNEGRGTYAAKSNLGGIQVPNVATDSLMDGVVNVYDANNVRYAGAYNRNIDANAAGYIGQGTTNWFSLGDLSDVAYLAEFSYQSSELSEIPIEDL